MKRVMLLMIVLLLAAPASATTWGVSEKTDPFTNEKIPAQEPMSYGGYVYHWPSKYDIVFWPFTAEKYICFNIKNGYGAFNNDFEKISDEEKKGLKKWLAENYDASNAPQSHKDKLAWLEKVYRHRQMDEDFWCRFYRLMAYTHRDDRQKSISYVKKAMPLLKKKLKSNPKGIKKIETLYLLGEYNRRIGEMEISKDFFNQVKTTTYMDRDGTEKAGHPYFLKLIQNRENPKEETPASK